MVLQRLAHGPGLAPLHTPDEPWARAMGIADEAPALGHTPPAHSFHRLLHAYSYAGIITTTLVVICCACRATAWPLACSLWVG